MFNVVTKKLLHIGTTCKFLYALLHAAVARSEMFCTTTQPLQSKLVRHLVIRELRNLESLRSCSSVLAVLGTPQPTAVGFPTRAVPSTRHQYTMFDKAVKIAICAYHVIFLTSKAQIWPDSCNLLFALAKPDSLGTL